MENDTVRGFLKSEGFDAYSIIIRRNACILSLFTTEKYDDINFVFTPNDYAELRSFGENLILLSDKLANDRRKMDMAKKEAQSKEETRMPECRCDQDM